MSQQQPPQGQPIPAPEGYETWNDNWTKVHNQPWRIGPEIDELRQQTLIKRQAEKVDIERGIYHFRDENGPIKLTRADLEWLLSKHMSGGMQGPIDWSDKKQREREGLDLRGADLAEEDLSGLPLARVRAGLRMDEWRHTTTELSDMAAAVFNGANLRKANLEGADLLGAQLRGAKMRGARLDQASLLRARLEGALLSEAHLEGANLRNVFFDADTILGDSDETLGSVHLVDTCGRNPVSLVDVHWGDANLTAVEWAHMRMLGEEVTARRAQGARDKKNARSKRVAAEYEVAARANQQLAVALRSQGLSPAADYFAYRAQVCRRKMLFYQHKIGRYFGSWLLNLIAGYGYRLWHSVVTYLVVVGSFAAAYYMIGHVIGPSLSPFGAFVFSMTSFHGRGYYPGGITPDDPLLGVAAFEALVGLIIEISLIATFTQRFFGR